MAAEAKLRSLVEEARGDVNAARAAHSEGRLTLARAGRLYRQAHRCGLSRAAAARERAGVGAPRHRGR